MKDLISLTVRDATLNAIVRVEIVDKMFNFVWTPYDCRRLMIVDVFLKGVVGRRRVLV